MLDNIHIYIYIYNVYTHAYVYTVREKIERVGGMRKRTREKTRETIGEVIFSSKKI